MDTIITGLLTNAGDISWWIALAIAIAWTVIKLKKPAWAEYVDKYKGTLLAGIKYADKAIPADSENKAMQKMKTCLEYATKIEAKLATLDQAALQQAIEVVLHEKEAAETKG